MSPEIISFSDVIAEVSVLLDVLGYTWKSERVMTYLKRVGVESRHGLNFEQYQAFASKLRETYGKERQRSINPSSQCAS